MTFLGLRRLSRAGNEHDQHPQSTREAGPVPAPDAVAWTKPRRGRYFLALGGAAAVVLAMSMAAPSAALADTSFGPGISAAFVPPDIVPSPGSPQGQIVNLANGLCLDSNTISPGPDLPGAGSVYLGTCTGSESQQWVAPSSTPGPFTGYDLIENVQTKYCLVFGGNLTLYTLPCAELVGPFPAPVPVGDRQWNWTSSDGPNPLRGNVDGLCLQMDNSGTLLEMSSPGQSCYTNPGQAWEVFRP